MTMAIGFNPAQQKLGFGSFKFKLPEGRGIMLTPEFENSTEALVLKKLHALEGGLKNTAMADDYIPAARHIVVTGKTPEAELKLNKLVEKCGIITEPPSIEMEKVQHNRKLVDRVFDRIA